MCLWLVLYLLAVQVMMWQKAAASDHRSALLLCLGSNVVNSLLSVQHEAPALQVVIKSISYFSDFLQNHSNFNVCNFYVFVPKLSGRMGFINVFAIPWMDAKWASCLPAFVVGR